MHHAEFDDKEYYSESWGWLLAAYNCKLVFSADEGLNGKLTVQILSLDENSASAYIYL